VPTDWEFVARIGAHDQRSYQNDLVKSCGVSISCVVFTPSFAHFRDFCAPLLVSLSTVSSADGLRHSLTCQDAFFWLHFHIHRVGSLYLDVKFFNSPWSTQALISFPYNDNLLAFPFVTYSRHQAHHFSLSFASTCRKRPVI
jgi:hypothetical protein